MTQPLDDFTDLKALFINCTLKRSPEVSNTQALVDVSAAIMEKHGVAVEVVRAIDHDIATGVWPDMREHGAASDDWPAIFEKVLAADILGVALARFCFLRAGFSGPSEVGTLGSESGKRKHKARRLAVTTPEWLPMVHAAGMACGISAVVVMCYLAYQFDL